MNRYALLAALMLCCISVSARDAESTKNGVVEKPLLADTPESFATQTERIHEEMQPGGRYEFANPSARSKVDMLLGKMASLLQAAGSVDAMNHDARIALFNSQEEVNGILKHNDSNRLVCESRAPVGSHIPVTTCRTFGEIEHGRRAFAIQRTSCGLSRETCDSLYQFLYEAWQHRAGSVLRDRYGRTRLT